MSLFTVCPIPLPQMLHQKPRSSCTISCCSIVLVESSSIGLSHVLSNSPTDTHTSRCASDKLRANLLLKQYFLEVDLRHVGLYNDELAHAIQDRPTDVLPLVRQLQPPYIRG